MEFLTQEIILYVLLLLLPLSLYIFINRRKCSSKLPPGKMGWPIIGETLEFVSSCSKGIPEKYYMKRTKKYSSNIFKTSLLSQKMIVLTGPEGHKFVFSNDNKLMVSWWPPAINKIFPSSARSNVIHDAKNLRGMLHTFLKPEALKNYVPMMDFVAKNHLLSEWLPNKEIKVLDTVNKYTFSLSSKLFMSIDKPERVAVYSKSFTILNGGYLAWPIDLPGTRLNRAIKASKFIRKEFVGIVKERRIDLEEKKASATQDIMSNMLFSTFEDGSSPEDEDIADVLMALTIGAHDTVTDTLTLIVKFLAENPDCYNKVYKEQMEISASKGQGESLTWDDLQKMKYSWNFVCETLRIAPSNVGTFREALSGFSYNNYLVPKGWKVLWSMVTTHKNPEYFPDPDKFDPSRFEGDGPAPYTFIPFGGGPRMCPGKEFTRMEILVFMHNLVKMFEWRNLIPDEKIIYNPGALPEKGLPIRLFPRGI